MFLCVEYHDLAAGEQSDGKGEGCESIAGQKLHTTIILHKIIVAKIKQTVQLKLFDIKLHLPQ